MIIVSVKFAFCFFLGFIGHFFGGGLVSYLESSPPESNRPVFYLLTRYIMGGIMLVIGQLVMINVNTLKKSDTYQEVFMEIVTSYLSGSIPIGSGVAMGYVYDLFKENK